MRVTPGMTADNALYNLQQSRAGLDALQEQISSGMVVNKPSDDPLTSRQLLDLQNQIAAGDQFSTNITKGTVFMNITSTALSGMFEFMEQIKRVVGTVSTGTTDAAAMDSAVSNLTQLKQQLVDMGNTQIGGQYVFAGFGEDPPFNAAGDFSGTDDALNIEIAQGSLVAMNISGGELLRGGSAPSAVPGGSPVDILGSLDDLIDAINNGDAAGITNGAKNMDAAAQQITASQTDLAGRLVRMNNMQSMITNNQNTLKGIYGEMQNVDYAKAGVQLSQQTTAFSAALATTAKLTQLSLLDYMR